MPADTKSKPKKKKKAVLIKFDEAEYLRIVRATDAIFAGNPTAYAKMKVLKGVAEDLEKYGLD